MAVCHAGFKLALKAEALLWPSDDSMEFDEEEGEEQEGEGGDRRRKNKEKFEYWMYLDTLGDVDRSFLPDFLVDGRTLGAGMVENEEEEGYDEDYGDWSVAASTRSFLTTMRGVKVALRAVGRKCK